jgi:hypothetical protein
MWYPSFSLILDALVWVVSVFHIKKIVFTQPMNLNPICCRLEAFCNILDYLYQKFNFMAWCQNNISSTARGANGTEFFYLENAIIKKW